MTSDSTTNTNTNSNPNVTFRPCPHCRRAFIEPQPILLNMHIQTDHPARCPVRGCGDRFRDVEGLEEHYEAVHGARPLKENIDDSSGVKKAV
jgi:hypothetical protein